jgi:ABC-type sulfate transport system permease component
MTASLLVIPFAVAVTDTADVPWATPITVAGLALVVTVAAD